MAAMATLDLVTLAALPSTQGIKEPFEFVRLKEGVKLKKSGFFGGRDLEKIENESYKAMSLK